MSLNLLTYQLQSNFQQEAAMFTASWVQLRLELLVCDRSVSVNVIPLTFVELKCLTETKIQILYDRVDQTRFHIVKVGCQMVQLLSAYNVGLRSLSIWPQTYTHLWRIRDGGVRGTPSPTNNVWRTKLTLTNYISLEENYKRIIRESDSF